jgi:filamentous hemagglutinin
MSWSSKPRPYTFYTKATWRRKLVAWSMLLVYLTQPILASAEVVADPKTPTANTPQVQTTANGLPVVQIAAPSKAGVSRNLYQQFNVDPGGLILNNSQVITQTQLAGYITGNPNLSNGSARIILNEVTSNNPSYLRGYTEVAGQKAEVIIANPNGIYGDGFGFINTSRAVLTTGTPVFGGSGSLEAFRVTKGNIAIEGKGLTATGVDRVDLISRAVAVNAGVWANDLNIVTGANNVHYDNLTTEKIIGEGLQPTVALDVSALGGMYANKIKLVGTDKGVGVNSQGTLAASGGDLILSQAGKISLAGTLSAAGNVAITSSESITGIGTIYAGGSNTLSAAGTIENKGTMAAGQNNELSAAGINSSGTLAAGIDSIGKLGNNGDLTLSADGQISAQGQNLAGGNLSMTGTTLDLKGAVTYAGQAARFKATSGNIDSSGGELGSTGNLSLTAADDINNRDGKISSKNELQLSARKFDNVSGEISAGDKLTISAAAITNQDGVIKSGNALKVTASGTVDNRAGQIEAQAGLKLSAQALQNQSGRLTSLDGSSLKLTLPGELNNTAGIIGSNGGVSISAGQINNADGQLVSKDNIAVNAKGDIYNSQGQITGGKDLTLMAAAVENEQGKMTAGQDLKLAMEHLQSSGQLTAGRDATVSGEKAVVNTGKMQAGRNLSVTGSVVDSPGTMQAQNNLRIQAKQRLSNSGAVAAGQNIELIGASIDSSGVLAAGVTADGSAGEKGDLTISATSAVTATGNNLAGGKLSISGEKIDLSGANTYAGDSLNLTTTSGEIKNTAGEITAKKALQINAAGSLMNEHGSISGDQVMIGADNIVNLDGHIKQSGNGATSITASNRLDNSGGWIVSNGQELAITASDINNKQGKIQQAGSEKLAIKAGDKLDNAGGEIATNGQAIVTAGNIHNSQGTILAQRQMEVKANSLQNNEGQLMGKQAVRIMAETIGNQQGLLEGGNGLTLTANILTNDSGNIISLDDSGLVISAGQKLSNTAGLIGGNGDVNVSAAQLDNTGGQLSAKQNLNLTTNDQLNNTSGTLSAGDNLTIKQTGGAIVNTQGAIQAGGALDMAVGGADVVGGSFAANHHIHIRGHNLASDKIQAGEDIAIQAENDFSANGQTQANGNLTVNAGGKVTNAGNLTAVEDIRITSDNLTNEAGAAIKSGGQLELTHKELNNQGTIYAKEATTLKAANKLANGGNVASGGDLALMANTIHSTGTLVAGLKSDAAVGNDGNLTIKAEGIVIASGENLAGGKLAIGGSSVDLSGAQTSGQSASITATDGDIKTSGGKVLVKHDLDITAAGRLVNDEALLKANALNLAAKTISNRGGTLAQVGQSDLTLTTDELDNTGGQIAANSGNLTISAGKIKNNKGEIQHAGSGKLTIQADNGLDNAHGEIVSNGQASLNAANFDNIQGTVFAQQQLNVQAGKLTNREGQVVGKQGVKVAAKTIDNTEGLMEAGSGLDIGGQTLVNYSGKVTSLDESGLHVTIEKGLSNQSGFIGGNGGVSVAAASMDNTAGQMRAKKDLTAASANGLKNTSGVVAAGNNLAVMQTAGAMENQNGVIQAGNVLNIVAAGADLSGGSFLAGKEVSIRARNLSSDNVQAGEDASINVQLDLTNKGQLQANGALDVTVGGAVNNIGSMIGLNRVRVSGADVTNGAGASIKSGDQLEVSGKNLTNLGTVYGKDKVTVKAGNLLTSSGTIAGGADVLLTAKTIDSTGTLAAGLAADGTVKSDGGLTLKATDKVIASGQNSAGGNLAIEGAAVKLSGAMTQAGQKGVITATAGDIDNSGGSLTAKGSLDITAKGKLVNDTATIKAAKLDVNAQSISNGGGVLAQSGQTDLTITTGELDNIGGQVATNSTNLIIDAERIHNSQGEIQHAGSGTLIIQADKELGNSDGQVISNGQVNISAASIDNTKGTIVAQRQLDIQAKKLINREGQVVGRQAVEIAADVDNVEGLVEAGQNLTVSGQTLVNDSGKITSLDQSGLNVSVTGKLTNTSGLIGGNGAVTVTADQMDNTDGKMSAKTDLAVKSVNALANRDGVMAAGNNLTITQASGTIENEDGMVQAGQSLTVAATGSDLSGGSMLAGKKADVSVKSLAINQLQAGEDAQIKTEKNFTNNGQVQANGALSVVAGGEVANVGSMVGLDKVSIAGASVTNAAGAAIKSNGQLEISGTQVSNQGTIYSKEKVTVNAGNTLSSSGTIASGADVELTAKTIDSTGMLAAGLVADGSVGNSGDLRLQATVEITAKGQNVAGGKLAIQGASVDVSGATTQANQSAQVTATSGNVDNSGGFLTAKGSLGIVAKGKLVNDEQNDNAGVMKANQLSIAAGSISNHGGVVAQFGQRDISISTGNIDNTDGQIVANSQNLTIDADQINNSKGKIQHAGSGKLKIQVDKELKNTGGQIVGNGQASVNAADIDNTQGTIFAQRQLELQANKLINKQGQIVGKQSVQIMTDVDNAGGLMEAGQGLTISGQTLVNNGGKITNLDQSGLNVSVTGKLTNTFGLIGGNGAVTVTTDQMDNTDGQMSAKTDLAIKSVNALANRDGVMAAGNNLIISQTSGTIENEDGMLQAGQSLMVAATGADLFGGSMLAGKKADVSAKDLTVNQLQAGEDAQIKTEKDFTNNGQVQANGALSVVATGKVTNAGSMVGLDKVSVTGASVTNAAGAAIKSGGHIDVSGTKVSNQGTVYGKEKVTVKADHMLTTSGAIAGGTDVELTAKTVESTGMLAAGLTNAGAVGSTGNLTLTASGNVMAKGQNLAGGNLAIQGASADVSGGNTYAGYSASITATAGNVDNSDGSLAAKESLAIAAKEKLVNHAAVVKANHLQIAAGNIDNRSGVVAQYGETDLTINTGKLDNTGGQIATNSANLVLNADKLGNSQGQIQHAGSGKLNVHTSGDLVNADGQMVSNGVMDLSVQTLNNHQGTVSAKNDLNVVANSLDNQAGVAVSNGKVSLDIDNGINNQSGIVEAGKKLTVAAKTINNQAGKLTSLDQSGLSVTVKQDLNNRSGLIGGNGAAAIMTKSLDNTGGQVLSAANLGIIASDGIDNTEGKLAASQDLIIEQQDADLVNSKGVVEAGRNLEIQAGAINNAQGRLAANNDLGLKFNALNGAGSVNARRNLSLTVGGDFTNLVGNNWKAVNDLSVSASGTVNNSGVMEAGGSLAVSGQQVTNNAGATLVANDELSIIAIGDVNNSGSMFGNDIKVKGSNIVNANETAAIAATNSVKLYATNALENKDGALIYSMGNIDISGSEVKSGEEYVNRAKSLLNQSANIEADGDIVIYADDVVNKKREFEVEYTAVTSDKLFPLEEEKRYEIPGDKIARSMMPNYNPNMNEGYVNLMFRSYLHAKEFKKISDFTYLVLRGQSTGGAKILKDSPVGKIIAGRNLTLQANNVLNDNSWLLARQSLFSSGSVTNQAVSSSSGTINHYALVSASGIPMFAGQTWGVGLYVYDLYDEVVGSESTPDSSTSARFGGGQQVIIDGTKVSNATVIPGSSIGPVKTFDATGRTSNAVEVDTNSGATVNTDINTSIGGSAAQGPAVGNIGSAGRTESATAVEVGMGNVVNTNVNTSVGGSAMQGSSLGNIGSAGQTGSANVVEAGTGNIVSTAVNTNVSGSAVQGPSVGSINSAGQTGSVAAVETSVASSAVTTVNTNVITDKPAVDTAGITPGTSSPRVSQVIASDSSVKASVGTSNTDPGTVAALLPTAQTKVVKPPQTNNGGTITLSQNGLYTIKPNPGSKYLVETNPKFANYKTFISSDYLLDKLNYDPAVTMKRLGDGFYEQKLVREQITDLTGRVYLNGYDSAEDQYQALLRNGATAADNLHLQVGVALSAEQQAALTTDLVWLVEKEVSGQKVLVPVVYLSILREGDLTTSGAIISADKVKMNLTGDVTNTGAIQAIESAKIGAANVSNIGGSIDGGQVTQIKAGQDILNLSGSISGDNITLTAGRDITSQTYITTMEGIALTTTTAAANATIAAGQNLAIDARRDLTLLGTDMSAGADIGVSADQNLTVASIAEQTSIITNRPVIEHIENISTTITAGGSVSMKAGQNLDLTAAKVRAGSDLSLIADGNLTINAAADKSSLNQYWNLINYNDQTTITNQLTSLIAGNDVTMVSGGDMTLTGGQATGNNITALSGGDLTLNNVTDSNYSDKKSGNSKNYERNMNYDETIIGTNLAATGNITLGAIDSITIAGSSAISEEGGITLNADKDITIEAVTEKHEALTESQKTKSGFLSKKTTTKRDYALLNEIVGSTISGETVDISTGNDLTVKASNIVAANDLSLTAGNDLSITSMAETGAEDHYSYTKKSGLFSGGGLGFTIGSKSEKLSIKEKNLAEIASTIGSIAGDVTLTAGNQLTSAGANISAGLDLDITGKKVTIDNTVDTYDSTTKFEVKQSGLSVSLGGTVVNKGLDAVNSIERAGQVADERLQALYAYKAYDDIKDLSKIKNSKDLKQNVSVSVSVGSSKSSSEQTVHMETVNASNISAGQNVTITAIDDDVNLTGTKINAKDITIQAMGDINLNAAQNQQQIASSSKSSSWGVGVELGTGLFGNIQKGSSKENGNTTTNSGSSITASDTATLVSGNDTNIIGSKVTGEKVVAEIGGDLNIASLQDIDNYSAKSTNSGISAGIGQGVMGSYSNGKTNSNYQSVTEQAGIYAGKDGFDIEVGKNTDLKGAVIASDATPDKNKLSTDTLTYSDIENKAEYSASSIGVNVNTGKDTEKKDAGLTPNIGGTASGDADSTTKSAVSSGTIEVRSNPNQDLSNLSRDTNNSLNVLGKIFDKKTVQEQQELANVFGQEVFKAVGDLKLKEGSSEKAAIDFFVGGLMAKLGGGDFLSGAASAGITQLVMKELANIKDPALLQWASALVGAAAAKVVGGNVQTGASVAVSETKNNFLSHEQYAKYQAQLKELKGKLEDGNITQEEYNKAVNEVTNYWADKDKEQEQKWYSEHQTTIDNINKDPGIITSEKVGVKLDGTDDYLSPEVVVTGTNPGIVENFIYDPNATATENAHKLLSLGGFTPLAPISEGANAIIYFAEGDNESAAMSAFAAIPGMKVLVVAKGAIKLVPETEAAVKFVQSYTKEVKAGENVATHVGDVVTGASKAESVIWKGFSNGKLKSHYEKHVVEGKEFGNISQSEYLKKAKEFATESSSNFQEAKVGNFNVKYDPETRRVFVGHEKSREIRTFYKADSRDVDPFQAAIKLAKELSGK